MTPQEAYRELLSIRKHIEDGYVTHLSYGGKADKQTEKNIETYSVAISALEKQIPKKAIDKTCEYDGYYGLCPCCNKAISEYKDFARCWYCGQALDWSDTE